MKKQLIIIMLAIFAMAMPQDVNAKVKSKATRPVSTVESRVIGKHLLSLQWISWKYFGSVTVKKEADGSLSCRGEQMARNCRDAEQGSISNDDYIKLDGTIEIIDANHLVFNGEIREKVYHINGGAEVLRTGRYDFKATNGRKFWRMEPMENPAEACVDYIDIYFKR